MNDIMNVDIATKTCKDPVAFDEAMKLIGDFWTLRLVDAIRGEEVRFCELERRVPDINPATLTNRLKTLGDAGIIDRRVETLDKQSVSYALTPRGLGIIPVLESIKQFTEDTTS